MVQQGRGRGRGAAAFAFAGLNHGADCAAECCLPGATKAIASVSTPLSPLARHAFLLVLRRLEVSLPVEVLRRIFEQSASVARRVITRPAPFVAARRAPDTGALGAAMGSMMLCEDGFV